MKRTHIAKLVALIIVTAILSIVIVFLMRANSTDKEQTLLKQFFISGGPVVWFVLFPMSLITTYIIFEQSLSIRRKRLLPPQIGQRLSNIIENNNLELIREAVHNGDDIVSITLRDALGKIENDWLHIRSAASESLQDYTGRLTRKIEWLNLIGGISPMIGLFGTVLGMIKLFNAIVKTGGQPQPVQLADGISVALVTTFWGLFIAIPALASYGILRNKIEALVGDAFSQIDTIAFLMMRKHLQKRPVEPSKPTQSKTQIAQIKPTTDRQSHKMKHKTPTGK